MTEQSRSTQVIENQWVRENVRSRNYAIERFDCILFVRTVAALRRFPPNGFGCLYAEASVSATFIGGGSGAIMAKSPWFFVRHIGSNEFEVQVLDDSGCAQCWAPFQRGAELLLIYNYRVPNEVLRTAERTPEIGNQYVDAQGRELDSLGNVIQVHE